MESCDKIPGYVLRRVYGLFLFTTWLDGSRATGLRRNGETMHVVRDAGRS